MEIIKLNLIPNGVNPTCHAKQYDEGRVIRFELFDGLTPYTLQSGDTVTLNLRKPDNTIIETSVTATQGNKYVDLVTTEQMCACVGYNLGTFKIANGSVDIGTLNFIMAVERDVLADGIPSQSVIEDLDALVQEAVGDNFYTKTEVDTALSAKANSADVYKKAQVDTALSSKADNSDITDLQDQIDTIKDKTLVSTDVWSSVSLTTQNGYYGKVNGEYNADAERLCAKLSVNEGEIYKLTTFVRPASISGLIYFNSNDQVVAHYLDGTGTDQTITDYEFTIPSGVASIAVQSADYRKALTLEKHSIEYIFAAYTKSETDQKLQLNKSSVKYGLRWDIDDPDDLGERCFGAVGLSASIGIGSTNGASDFDNIYPWSEIKRCNIKVNANGAKIVTFEGETGFALDGTNGDVFVRIPKFYIEKYQKDGYEYRTISATGAIVHPLFIENGEELDEVFISAFEGYVDSNNKLRSIGGVIPTSNITAQEFLTAAQSNGDNYSLYDMRCVDAIWTLLAVEFGCRNTNQVLGYGLADFEQPTNKERDFIILAASNTNTVRTIKATAMLKYLMPVGSNITICDTDQTNILTQAKITACVDGDTYTDWTFDGDPINVTTSCYIGSAAFNTNWCESAPSGALSWHTGRNNWITSSNTQNAVRYRWIENVVGNLWHFLPDITFNNLQMYICKNMKDYVMHKYTSPYEPVSDLFTVQSDNGSKTDVSGSNYWITSLNQDPFAKGVLFGRTYDKSLLSTKAFGGYYYLYSSIVVICNGGGFDHLYRCNMLTQRAWQLATTRWYLYGARMMYKNIS